MAIKFDLETIHMSPDPEQLLVELIHKVEFAITGLFISFIINNISSSINHWSVMLFIIHFPDISIYSHGKYTETYKDVIKLINNCFPVG